MTGKPTSRKKSGRRTVGTTSELAAANVGSAQFCAVCFLTFGSQERRILMGEKVAHLRCARRLSGPTAA